MVGTRGEGGLLLTRSQAGRARWLVGASATNGRAWAAKQRGDWPGLLGGLELRRCAWLLEGTLWDVLSQVMRPPFPPWRTENLSSTPGPSLHLRSKQVMADADIKPRRPASARPKPAPAGGEEQKA